MSTLNASIKFPPVPDSFRGNLDKFLTWMSENAEISIDGEFLTGQVGGAIPSQDVGLVVVDGIVNVWNSDKGRYIPMTVLPIASIIPWASIASVPPENFLMCEGQAVLRADYPDLFEVIGVKYGSNSSGDFKVPDMRSRVPVGAGQSSWKTGGNNPDLPPGTYYGTPHLHNIPNYPGSGIPSYLATGLVAATTQVSSVYQPSTVLRMIIRAK